MARDWDKYIGAPFKHLGLDIRKGIDCFNLIKYVYKEELNIDIPYSTRDWCSIIDEDWYARTHEDLIKKACNTLHGWEKVGYPEEFDVITMTFGSSTITNHCAMYISHNKILHIFPNHKSHISEYGSFYKQYTTGIYRWINTNR